MMEGGRSRPRGGMVSTFLNEYHKSPMDVRGISHKTHLVKEKVVLSR
jgi:hypothetical protein